MLFNFFLISFLISEMHFLISSLHSISLCLVYIVFRSVTSRMTRMIGRGVNYKLFSLVFNFVEFGLKLIKSECFSLGAFQQHFRVTRYLLVVISRRSMGRRWNLIKPLLPHELHIEVLSRLESQSSRMEFIPFNHCSAFRQANERSSIR